MQFRHPALRSKQTRADKWLTQFTAPAPDIDRWAGVPQKKRMDTGEETTGFQREEHAGRIKSLKEFYLNEENLIQNPLLGSLRKLPISSVTFTPSQPPDDDSATEVGHILIEVPDFSSLSLREIFGLVREYIEDRVPELRGRAPNENSLITLRQRAAESGHLTDSPSSNEDLEDEGDINEGTEDGEGDASGALFEESHILDFWQEVAGRHELLKEIGADAPEDLFLGFTRDALLAYLKPVVLVDGQHRLRGALAAAQETLNSPPLQAEIEERIAQGESWRSVEDDLLKQKARNLPISLLMSTDPAEQVFQFVVVNQKATPVGRALLGTIVSTTLSNDEMQGVANRLKKAGIQLEESQAITFLARHPDSPFCGLIERGLSGDNKDLLQWNVFASLIGIFRNLAGGRLFHEKRADYAAVWCTRFLPDSPIVSDYAEQGFDSPYRYWSSLEGPWRAVFIAFWTAVRDRLGDTTDPGSYAYWGRTRESNLFNKVSLTILAADFFQFLVETRTPLTSATKIPELVDIWLENVNPGYFKRNWNLAGVKKDSTGIRSQWAQLWAEYRKIGGNLPDRRNYRQPRSE